jgi:hypothetical protein
VSFELWHNGVKLSKDNSIKVEWHASAPPPDPTEEVVSDVPVSGAGMGRAMRMSTGNLLGVGRKPMMGMGVNGHINPTWNEGGNGNGYVSGGWDNKTGMQTHVTPLQQNGSTVW